jgi:CHASE2 domain-containing sensor protein
MTPEVESPCKVNQSFNLQIALKHLESREIFSEPSSKEYLKLGRTIFMPLSTSRKGGYHSLDSRGYQILMNYRTPLGNIARKITLAQALENPIRPEWIKDKVVLIGVTASSVKDDHITPFSMEKPLRGLLLQAQMVSQIISAVLDNRPLLWVWPDWGENLWIFAWSAVGGALVWRVRSPLFLCLICSAMLISLLFICWILLKQGGWVPLVTPALVLVVTPTGTLTIIRGLK